MIVLTKILSWIGKIFLTAGLIFILGAIIAAVSFGATFGSRLGWLIGERYAEQCVKLRVEHVEESIRSTTVNP